MNNVTISGGWSVTVNDDEDDDETDEDDEETDGD